jgi:hypothetical protein
MDVDDTEYKEVEQKKKAIFDGMSKRGQERILRVGYDNWNPFQEPKDPRERIFSSASLKATAIVKEFYQSQAGREESVALHKELFDLCRGLLQDDARSRAIYEFCAWYKERLD